MDITRRNLLKGLVSTPGLVVVAGGMMDRDGEAWARNQQTGEHDAFVFMYARLTAEEKAFHATDAQITRFLDEQSRNLTIDFVRMVQKYRREGWPVTREPNPFLRSAAPDENFYRGA